MNINNALKYIIKKRGVRHLLVECKNPLSFNFNNDPYAVIDYGSRKAFESQGLIKGEWWQVRLDKYYILPISYRIKTFNLNPNQTHMKEWNLLASNDNNTWVSIDSQNTPDLNNKSVEKIFPLDTNKTMKAPFSYFRIENIKNIAGTYRLSLSEFDINGIVYNVLFCSNGRKCYRTFSLSNFFFVVCLLES